MAGHPPVSSAALIGCDHCTVEGGAVVEASYLGRLGRDGPEVPADRLDGTTRYFGRLPDQFFTAGWILLPSTVIAHRSVLLDVGAFDESLAAVEDYECFMRVLARHPLAVVADVLVRYRLHARNAHRNGPLMASGCAAISRWWRSGRPRIPSARCARRRPIARR